MLRVVVIVLVTQVPQDWLFYQQEVRTCLWKISQFYKQHVNISVFVSPQAPPTLTDVTAQLTSTTSVRVTWQWTSSGPAPNCFNTTRVTYHPEGGGESSLQLRNPAATEITLTDLQCITSYTITVVATAGEHKRKGVAFLPIQGILK